jgi:hypothetical protein
MAGWGAPHVLTHRCLMTRLALVVVVWLSCVALFGDEPKKPQPLPPTALEGAWQEAVLLGEDPAVRYKITITDDKVTIRHREQVLTGTFEVSSESEPFTITMKITGVKGDGSHVRGTYRGIYEVEKDRVSLRFNPVPARPPIVREIKVPGEDKPRIVVIDETALYERSGGLRLAPVTLTLHKVKK